MMTYKVFLYNMISRQVYAEVPFASLSYSYVMDEPGKATIEIPMGATRKDGAPIAPIDLFPVRTGVAIQRGTDLVWGGILWAYRMDLSRRTITLSAQGYLSYYRYRHTATDGQRYKGIEQITMIQALINTCNINNGISTNATELTTTNMVRDRSWNPYEFKQLDAVFSDLCDDITSFDPVTGKYGGGFFLYFEPYWWLPGSHIGNKAVNTANRHPYGIGATLQQGQNCEFTEVTVDGTGLATTAFAVGATDGQKSLTPFASDENSGLLDVIPQLNTVLNENSAKSRVALQYKVRSALSFGSAPTIIPHAQTYPNQFSPLTFKPGMRTFVTTDDGFLNLVDEVYVVTEASVSVASDGSDRISLSLVQDDLFKETDPWHDLGPQAQT
jgi:hypothetical protein